MTTRRNKLSDIWYAIQQDLFPFLEKILGPLSLEYKQLAAILELVRIEEFIACTRFNFGRPVKDRTLIARAFIAKIVLKIPYTKQLVKLLKTDTNLKVLCGWDQFQSIPSASSFSRAFEEFANSDLPERVHEALIENTYNGKIVQHVTKDSTSIRGRERYLKKKGSSKERKKQSNTQNRKDKANGCSRKQKQLNQDLATMLSELPKDCDIGSKKGSQGHITTWKGYKLHVAVDDDCIPLAAILTSASLNDSEVAIPLAEKAKRVTSFYDLMDAAYDISEIKEHSRSINHVPIIDSHPRTKTQKAEKQLDKLGKRVLNFSTCEDARYKTRFSKERSNALLKEYYGGNTVQYKGHKKVGCHLMFGVLTLTASMLLSCIT